MKRILYSCDWCSLAAPKIDEVPAEWRFVTLLDRAEELLCGGCKGVLDRHIYRAAAAAKQEIDDALAALRRNQGQPAAAPPPEAHT